MNKSLNQIRLFLCTCSGEDDFVIRKCSKRIQLRFALIGFFVLLIFFGCFLSATTFTYSLFQGITWISLAMGVIWGSVIVNIYLLLLYTISPKLLPVAFKNLRGQTVDNDEKLKEDKFLTTSMLGRLGFMTLLAIIIAQPLNVLIISNSVESSIEKHKIVQKIKMFTIANKASIDNEVLFYKEFNKKIQFLLNKQDSIYVSKQILLLNSKVSDDKKFINDSDKLFKSLKKIDEMFFIDEKSNNSRDSIINLLNTIFIKEIQSDTDFAANIESITINNKKIKSYFEEYKTNLIKTINLKLENTIALNKLLEKSNFYIKTIQLLLYENLLSWIITFVICLIFLMPIYFKFKVRDLSESFFISDYKDDSEMKRLRAEITNTSDFRWLQDKIKKLNIIGLRTSDYYFQRIVIEHRMILENYDSTKQLYSSILTAKNQEFNQNSLERIKPILEKLKQINIKSYKKLKVEIDEEYKDELFKKYEYWLDAPFRTKKRNISSVKNDELSFLDFIYQEKS